MRTRKPGPTARPDGVRKARHSEQNTRYLMRNRLIAEYVAVHHSKIFAKAAAYADEEILRLRGAALPGDEPPTDRRESA